MKEKRQKIESNIVVSQEDSKIFHDQVEALFNRLDRYAPDQIIDFYESVKVHVSQLLKQRLDSFSIIVEKNQQKHELLFNFLVQERFIDEEGCLPRNGEELDIPSILKGSAKDYSI